MFKILNNRAREFLNATAWSNAASEPLTGDASARKYFRLRRDQQSAVLMDASQNLDSVPPFIRINQHLQQIGFSVPNILARDEKQGFLLLEDFGDDIFSRLLDNQSDAEKLFTLGTDVLIALHQHPRAIPKDLRAYHPEKMLADIELFLEWCTPTISDPGREEFRTVWRDVLPVAHQVPISLLLRDYHVANLMLLPGREGIQQAGLLDFQDAYQGPITYDLVSLLEDARHDVPDELKEKMVARYLARAPALDRKAFETSMAILAALRHTRILAIFERLSRHEGKHDYKKLHSPRVERLLQRALRHPMLAGVKRWMECYAR
ncbi:MAG: phosphotransferase [Verrucomicrobiota bacterium]|jgi:aminoglycoside/choline kinase family phosphotransferase